MQQKRPKPISLRPLSASEKRWMWGTIVLCVLFVVVGWVFTVGRILHVQVGDAKQEVVSSFQETGGRMKDVKATKEQMQQVVGRLKDGVQERAEFFQAEAAAQAAVIDQVKTQIQQQSTYGTEKTNGR